MSACEDSLYDRAVAESGQYSRLVDKYASHACVIAAEKEGEFIGYAAFYCNDMLTKTAYLSMIVVQKKYQGNGVGAALMDLMEKICRQSGCGLIRLEVDVNNLKAKNLYKKFSYQFECSASDHTEYMRLNLNRG